VVARVSALTENALDASICDNVVGLHGRADAIAVVRGRDELVVAGDTLVGHQRWVHVDVDQRGRRDERRDRDERDASGDEPAEPAELHPRFGTGDDVVDGTEGEQPDGAATEDALTEGYESIPTALGRDEARARGCGPNGPTGVDRLERAGEGEEGDDEHGVGDPVIDSSLHDSCSWASALSATNKNVLAICSRERLT